ncbi:MAG: tryptophan 7-halogenase [Hyphomonadaceae bacterium]|nr:tryptophan 7-halogenase [Hyphomonadaceae bacterium]
MADKSKGIIKSIVILGGGSAGWMTAAALSSMLHPKDVKITLIESEQIGTIGVGEATIPDVINFNRLLGIPEDEFMKATNATFKLGIEFNNWGRKGDSYFHPFGVHGADMQGIDFHQYWLHLNKLGNGARLHDFSLGFVASQKNKFSLPNNDPRSVLSTLRYAYHFDATRYALFLRDYAEKRGVVRVEGKVKNVSTSSESGNIETLHLEFGEDISGEFFFDCTGFRSLLLSKTLGVKFVDWTHWLPCNSAQAIACEQSGPLLPYTKATAKDAGWQWRIPTQHRTGNGHIYSSEFMTDENAGASLLADLDGAPIGTPRQLRFTTGCREKFWEKNCIAVGLSSGFLEPLESTSIYLIQMGISRFISLYPDSSLSPVVRDEYNTQMRLLFDHVRDFIILHYSATERDDTPFWEYCKNMSIPDSLTRKIELFKEAGRVFRYEDELFAKTSWSAVFVGQNIVPRTVDPIVSTLPPSQVQKSLLSMQSAMNAATDKMPTHKQFIDKYCPSPAA